MVKNFREHTALSLLRHTCICSIVLCWEGNFIISKTNIPSWQKEASSRWITQSMRPLSVSLPWIYTNNSGEHLCCLPVLMMYADVKQAHIRSLALIQRTLLLHSHNPSFPFFPFHLLLINGTIQVSQCVYVCVCVCVCVSVRRGFCVPFPK